MHLLVVFQLAIAVGSGRVLIDERFEIHLLIVDLLPSLHYYQPHLLFGHTKLVNYGLVVVLLGECLPGLLDYAPDSTGNESQVLNGLRSMLLILHFTILSTASSTRSVR